MVSCFRAGTLGCSLGAWWSLHLSALRPDDLAAAVLFYGAGEADFSRSRAVDPRACTAYLGHFAEHDPWEPLAQVREMEAALRAAGREVTVHLYPGTGHWFFEDSRPQAFDAPAARLAWDRTLAFLHAHLPPLSPTGSG
ncbi:MAG: dienelactone hydrolase family protein [Cytophagales bacterium]|nr:dienelactone hydrolase family protein [Armatimonadota bacterium]